MRCPYDANLMPCSSSGDRETVLLFKLEKERINWLEEEYGISYSRDTVKGSKKYKL
jgi:hypothetical protein